jgi:hypothetical protein
MGSAIILTAVVLLYRFIAFPRTLFIIEYFLLTTLVLGSRFSFRLFHEIGKEAHGANVRRFGVVGAGDRGERLGRELRNDENRAAVVACFIDDDSSKIGLTLQGVPIAGPISRLREICREYELDEVVLGISKIEEIKLRALIREAQAAGISVEGQHSTLSKERESPVLVFDRLRRGLGRRAAPADRSRTFYRGKQVLITEGSVGIGPALARALAELGASVTVRLDSPGEAVRFGSDISVYVGPFAARSDMDGTLQTTAPDVVFHCVTLGVEGISNAEDYLWAVAVDRPRTLCEAIVDSPASSLAVLSFWGGLSLGSKAARLGAVCEALVLNDPSLRRVAVKTVRFPRILDEDGLMRLYDGAAGAAAQPGYELLEPEAVALALECAAAEPARAVITPVWDGTFSPAAAASIIAGPPVPARDSTPSNEAEERTGKTDLASGRLFPGERLAGSVTEGARLVVGPVYPVDDELTRIFSGAFHGSKLVGRDEWLRVLTSSLYQVAAPGVPSTIDD